MRAIEPAIAAASNSAEPVQFERQGYFVRDPDSTPDRPVFNRTVGLRDTFAKEVGGRSGWVESMPSAADDIASGVMARWSAAFGKFDADALASLYSKHAFFFGSNPTLYRGRDGVEAYFTGLPQWNSRERPVHRRQRRRRSVADLINMAGTANFSTSMARPKLSVKITWVIVREDGDWKIVSHHVSSKAPLLIPGVTNRYCCPSFETAASWPPQDEVRPAEHNIMPGQRSALAREGASQVSV